MKASLGQLLIVGFSGTRPEDPGVQHAVTLLASGAIGGVILYRYNIESPAQLKALVAALKAAPSPLPPLIAVDQEGGQVQRIGPEKGFGSTRSAKEIGADSDTERVRGEYRRLASELQKLGFNLTFAPCVDVDSSPPCSVIGGMARSYSQVPEVVANYAEIFIREMRGNGVLTACKHFPGHGSARGDTHTGLVDISSDWREAELLPYRELSRRGALDMVMSGHLVHRAVDAGAPVVFSSAWVRRLRDEIGFHGPLVTDDLHMGAIIGKFPLAEIAVRAISAGHDLLLFSQNPLALQKAGIRHDQSSAVTSMHGNDVVVPDPNLAPRVTTALQDAVDSGALPKARVIEALDRVVELKRRVR